LSTTLFGSLGAAPARHFKSRSDHRSGLPTLLDFQRRARIEGVETEINPSGQISSPTTASRCGCGPAARGKNSYPGAVSGFTSRQQDWQRQHARQLAGRTARRGSACAGRGRGTCRARLLKESRAEGSFRNTPGRVAGAPACPVPLSSASGRQRSSAMCVSCPLAGAASVLPRGTRVGHGHRKSERREMHGRIPEDIFH
jgi:hypothetical protein